jgi:2-keto-4-pentenoate hydratase/2-oxohepta-3-ene-1,7-dioic acid hydratase in catechol pathway
MRFATFLAPHSPVGRVGVVEGDQVLALPAGPTMVDLLEDLSSAGAAARRSPDAVFDLGEVRLLAPVPVPPSIRDFSAFEDHVRTARATRSLEVEPDWYQLPVFYFSNPAAVVGPGVGIPVPPGCDELDYELEVAAVVGRPGADLDPATAEAHIAGYTVMNDWSARDLQRREMRLGLGPAKGKDFATSLGPVLVTPDELEPLRRDKAFDLAMTARVNGTEWSRGRLSDIYWSFGELVAHASRGTVLRPGDVIGSGTCGTGCILELSAVHGSSAYPWLTPGDMVELVVEQLGTLANGVVAETEPPGRQ